MSPESTPEKPLFSSPLSTSSTAGGSHRETTSPGATGQTPVYQNPDWFSYSDQTDLEELKRKVEQLKAQAFRPTEPAKAVPPATPEATSVLPTRPTPAPTPAKELALPSLDAAPLFKPTIKTAPVIAKPAEVIAHQSETKSTFQPAFHAPAGTGALQPKDIEPVSVDRHPLYPYVTESTSKQSASTPSQPVSPPTLATPAIATNNLPRTEQVASTASRPKILPTKQPASNIKPAREYLPANRREPGGYESSSVSPEDLRGALRNERHVARTGVPFSVFTMTFMYAVVVSTVCGYLVQERMNGRPSILESLPDVPMPMVNGQAGYRFVPESAKLPAGHALTLGKSRKFGQVTLTPLSIEQHPVGELKQDCQLVLRLRVQNTSADQSFSPLDDALLTTKVADPLQPGVLRSNSFVCSEQPIDNWIPKSLMVSASDPRLKDADPAIGYYPPLAPGEWYETAIVCEPVKISEATLENYVWRLQVRKGLCPETGTPVTTLVEVLFNQHDLQNPAGNQLVSGL